MTEKQSRGISKKYFDYTQAIIVRTLKHIDSKCPDAYKDDAVAAFSYFEYYIFSKLERKTTPTEKELLHSLFGAIADIIANGSTNAITLTRKLETIVRKLPVKRYFEITHLLASDKIIDINPCMLFAPVMGTFYFPNGVCVGTGVDNEPVVRPLRCNYRVKNIVMFACGVVHLVQQKSIFKLEQAGIPHTYLKELFDISTVAQSANYGCMNNINISDVEIPYWYATQEKVMSQFSDEADDGNKISRLIFGIFNEEDNYLLHRTKIFQDKIVHLNFSGTIFGNLVKLEKFYIHEVHEGNIHNIAFEYEKDGCLVTSAFGIDSFFLTDGFPYTEEAIIVALWLRSHIANDFDFKHVKVVGVEANLESLEIWYENPKDWKDYFSSDRKRREETKARSFSNQIVHIDPFVRRLANGKKASESAKALAKRFHIDLPEGSTIVTEFDRHYGGAQNEK